MRRQLQFHICVQKLHSHNSERIIKINPRSTKLCKKQKGCTFYDSQCTVCGGSVKEEARCNSRAYACRIRLGDRVAGLSYVSYAGRGNYNFLKIILLLSGVGWVILSGDHVGDVSLWSRQDRTTHDADDTNQASARRAARPGRRAATTA